MTASAPQQDEFLALKALVGQATVSPFDAVATLDETGITAADFTDHRARVLFSGIDETVRAGKTPEVVSLLARVGAQVPRDVVVDVLTNYELGVAPRRLAFIRQTAQRRELLGQLRELTTVVANKSISLDTAIGETQRVLSTLGAAGDTLRTTDVDLLPFIDKLESIQRGEREAVLATGVEALDHFVALRRTLIVIGSMPGVGKSALIAGIVRNLIARSVKVGVISLEDEREWLVRRLLADASGVPLFVLGSRPMTTAQMARVNEASEATHKNLAHLLMEDRPGMTTAEVVAVARRMVAAGCQAIFIDHLGEIRLERSDRHDLDIMEALQSLRALAKQYQVPIVVASHLRRRDGLDVTTMPKLSDFAFSAAVERMARVALGLYRSESSNVGCVVLKQTEGPAGLDFELNFSKLQGIVIDTPVNEKHRAALQWVTQ